MEKIEGVCREDPGMCLGKVKNVSKFRRMGKQSTKGRS